MPQISATHLARHLSEILDGVEHRGESFTIERHGRPVARIEAAPRRTGREIREALERIPRDPELADALEAVRKAYNRPVLPPDPWSD